jgi:hypothetical protein
MRPKLGDDYTLASEDSVNKWLKTLTNGDGKALCSSLICVDSGIQYDPGGEVCSEIISAR